MNRNIFEILKEEHSELKNLLGKVEDLENYERADALESIKSNLIPHARGEEKTLYAMTRKTSKRHGDEDSLNLANEAYEEHRAVDKLINDLEDLSVNDEKWLPRFMVIKENIEHHIKEEENELFKKCREFFSPNELSDMGGAYLTEKEKFSETLPTQAQIKSRDLGDSMTNISQ